MKSRSRVPTKPPASDAKGDLPKGVYREGGKGRKKCPIGDHYIAARAIRCPLCHDLPTEQVAVEKAINIVNNLGGLDEVKVKIEAAEAALEDLRPLGGLEGARKVVAMLEKLEAIWKGQKVPGEEAASRSDGAVPVVRQSP